LNRETDNEREDDKGDRSTHNIDGVFVPSLPGWSSATFLMSVTHVSLSLIVDGNRLGTAPVVFG
jgi:hypothetical protein